MDTIMKTKTLQTKIGDVQESCLERIHALRAQLDGIEARVFDDDPSKYGVLNDLGEIQGAASMLDCRLATLATLRNIRSEMQDNDNAK